jgi:hypothetical protein
MSITNLITSFTTSCWIPLSKALVSLLKTLDKKIPNFQLFFNAKKYNSTNKVNFTDKERYDVFIDELMKLVKTEVSFTPFTTNFIMWSQELEYCLKQEQVYVLLSGNFLKGSYVKMVDDINRLLIPKNTKDDDDDNDNIEPTENLKKWVKNYSQDLLTILDDCVKNGYYLYKSEYITTDDDITPVCEKMLNLENSVFSIYSVSFDKIIALWVSDKFLELESVDLSEYVSILTDPKYSFNLNPEHQTNIDTIKRNYINKQYDLFKSHVKMLIRNNSLYFYKAIYLHSDDYNDYSELQLSNAVNSFPISFEDYAKNAFALFYFTKNDKITVTTYWMTNKPSNLVLSGYDHDLFEWLDSDYNDFLSASMIHINDRYSILH